MPFVGSVGLFFCRGCRGNIVGITHLAGVVKTYGSRAAGRQML